MPEHTIHWNAANDEWLCLRCLRSSNQISKEDAEDELSQFHCLSIAEPEAKPITQERRGSIRKKTSLPAEIVLRAHTVPIRVTTADLSLGGCYIENMFTLPIGTHLRVTLWIGEEKLRVKGIVKTCDPVFGNGIQFQEFQDSDRTKLESYLNSAAESENDEAP